MNMGGQKAVRLVFDQVAAKILFANGQRFMFSEVSNNSLSITPVMGSGRKVRAGGNHSAGYKGDEVSFDDKNETASVDLLEVNFDATDFFAEPRTAWVKRDGYKYAITAAKSKDSIGSVSIIHYNTFDDADVVKVSMDFNTAASYKLFPLLLAQRQSGMITTDSVVFTVENGNALMKVGVAGDPNAIAEARVWAKGNSDDDNSFGTVKADISVSQAKRLGLKPGWRYAFVSTFETDEYRLEENSEVKHMRHRKNSDKPLVTLSVVRKAC